MRCSVLLCEFREWDTHAIYMFKCVSMQARVNLSHRFLTALLNAPGSSLFFLHSDLLMHLNLVSRWLTLFFGKNKSAPCWSQELTVNTSHSLITTDPFVFNKNITSNRSPERTWIQIQKTEVRAWPVWSKAGASQCMRRGSFQGTASSLWLFLSDVRSFTHLSVESSTLLWRNTWIHRLLSLCEQHGLCINTHTIYRVESTMDTARLRKPSWVKNVRASAAKKDAET